MVKQPLHLITRSDLCPFYEKQGFAKQRGSNKSVYEPKDDEVYMMGSRATLCPRNEQNSIIMAFASWHTMVCGDTRVPYGHTHVCWDKCG